MLISRGKGIDMGATYGYGRIMSIAHRRPLLLSACLFMAVIALIHVNVIISRHLSSDQLVLVTAQDKNAGRLHSKECVLPEVGGGGRPGRTRQGHKAPVFILPDALNIPLKCRREVLLFGVEHAGVVLTDDLNKSFVDFYEWGVRANCGQKWFKEVRSLLYICLIMYEEQEEKKRVFANDLRQFLREERPGIDQNMDSEIFNSQLYKNTLKSPSSEFHKRFINNIPRSVQQVRHGDFSGDSPVWMKSYQMLHNAILDPANTDVDKKYLVYSCPRNKYCGGHGDRLKGMTMLLLMALLTDRALLIHHPNPKLCSSFSPNRIKWDLLGEKEYEMRMNTSSSLYVEWMSFVDYNYMMDLEREVFLNKTFVAVTHNLEGVGVLLGNSHFQAKIQRLGLLANDGRFLMSQLFHYLFKPSQEVERILGRFRVKHPEYTRDPVIAIHIRTGVIRGTGERVGEIGSRVGLEMSGTFFDLASRIEERKELKNAKWFLATDNESLKRCASRVYPGKIIMKKEEPVHTNHGQTDQEHAVTTVEQVLLMESDILIYSRSGFSELAFEFGHFEGYSSFKYDVTYSDENQRWWYNTDTRPFGPNVEKQYVNLETYPCIKSDRKD